MIIIIPVRWTNYTATVSGRVMKLVPCENCSNEFVYTLEREGEGIGTTFYDSNHSGARDHATSAAKDTLHQYLENDFDPVPCPICGHYQQYMFPKLYVSSSWLPFARLAILPLGCLDAIGAMYWTAIYLQQPSDHALMRLSWMWPLLAILGLSGWALGAVERSRVRRFNPNTEDQQLHIEKGRRRAISRAEFEAAQHRVRGAGTADHAGGSDSI